MTVKDLSKLRRMIAGIMAFIMLFAVLFFTSFIAIEAHHDCHGDECPICEAMEICRNILHSLGSTTLFVVVFAFFVSAVLFRVPVYVCFPNVLTPVSSRVRMND